MVELSPKDLVELGWLGPKAKKRLVDSMIPEHSWEYVALRGLLQASLIILVACTFVWLFGIG